MYFLYTLALTAGTLALLPYFLFRSLAEPEILLHFRERLGQGRTDSTPPPTQAPIWVHAASVGEVQVAGILIRRLRERIPQRKVILSTTTPAGRRVARETLGNQMEDLFYLPLDFPFAVKRRFDTLRPSLFLSIETEIWPGLLRECRRRGIPSGLVNGRISRKSYRWYRCIRPLLGPALSGMAFLCMQSRSDEHRVRRLGAPEDRTWTTGNIKYDFLPTPEALASLRELSPPTEGGKFLVAGSTAAGEEEMVLRAFRNVRSRFPDLRLILAPRHPDRFDEVARLLEREQFPMVRRSRPSPAPGWPWEVLLLDSLGELPLVYGLAHVAFVGGSLVPRGGHNLVEPAAWGKPVIFGPFVENFEPISRALLSEGGGIQVQGPEDLERTLNYLLEDPGAYQRAAEGPAAAPPTTGEPWNARFRRSPAPWEPPRAHPPVGCPAGGNLP